jgi:hypothetical protein
MDTKKEDIIQLYNKSKHKQNFSINNTNQEKKSITFTYTGNYIRKITNLCRNTNLKIAFKTTSTITNVLNNKQTKHIYKQSGIYKLTCQSCYKVYIGQTGRSLKTRYKERIRSTKNNKEDSAFAQHILNTGHQYGPIELIVEMIERVTKGMTVNIKEKF